MKPLLLAVTVCVWAGCFLTSTAYSQVNSSAEQIKFNSFLGTYNLSRDSKGVSLLTTEETILADFPPSGNYYGITRMIPNKYQGRSVDLRVTSIVDAAGNQIQYKTSNDAGGYLVVKTGDPTITLYGLQTIKIRYQTRGVVNLQGETNQFLLNTNGIGWEQPFGVISAVVNISKGLQSELASEPTCYINTGKLKTDNCEIETSKKPDNTVITSKTSQLPAHQALVIDMTFGPSSFKQYNAPPNRNLLIITAGLVLIAGSVVAYYLIKKKKFS